MSGVVKSVMIGSSFFVVTVRFWGVFILKNYAQRNTQNTFLMCGGARILKCAEGKCLIGIGFGSVNVILAMIAHKAQVSCAQGMGVCPQVMHSLCTGG